MNPLTSPRISLSARKFISSLAAVVVENPPDPHGKHETNPTPFDPFHFFSHYTKSNIRSITNTKMAHAHLLKHGALYSDVFVVNSLMDWYCKCGGMGYALVLFDKSSNPNVISWNIMISGCNNNFLFNDSWRIFCRMRLLGFDPNQFTYGSVLSACTALQSVMSGKQLYSLALKNGFYTNGYVRAGMIDLFAKSCSFEDALKMFCDVSCENVVCWNAIIAGAVRNGKNRVSLDLFFRMCHGYLMPNRFTFSSVLTACATLEELEMGRRVQGWVIKCGAGDDVFVGTAIIDLYAKCGNMDNAIKQFSTMPIRNVVSWTAIVSGFVQMDDSVSALQFFKEMRKMREEINNFTATSVLTACAKPGMFKEAIQIHSWILKCGLYSESAVRASLIKMYSNIGVVNFSDMVFRETDNVKILGTWTAMISAFAQNESSQRAIELFLRMLQEGLRPDKFCSSSVLSIVDCLKLGRQIHCYTLKSGFATDISVGSSLFTMYSKCGNLEESYEVFEQMLDRDNVSWASMIAGFAEHGYADQAIQLFREMLSEETRPDAMTLTAILTACSAIQSLQKGKEVHGYALRAGVGKETLVGGALVNMYSKCCAIDLARRVFDTMPQKDSVSCSSLVSGYAQHGYIDEALFLFHQIWRTGWGVDFFTVSSALGIVALFNRSDISTQLHAHVIKMGLDTEVSIGSSLVRAYSKCGSFDDCRKAFDQIGKPDLISWTAMIVSYAQHGKGAEALKFFELMKKSGIKPDAVTFVGVLSACSHTGLVEEGYFHLNSMTKDYGIEPGYRHYACIVDLLGRSGRLKEAECFIYNMPVEPDALVWGTLLAACKVHGDVELGRLAANKIFELKPCDAGAHVSMSNIWAEVEQWEQVMKIRSLMKGTGVTKESAWSFV